MRNFCKSRKCQILVLELWGFALKKGSPEWKKNQCLAAQSFYRSSFCLMYYLTQIRLSRRKWFWKLLLGNRSPIYGIFFNFPLERMNDLALMYHRDGKNSFCNNLALRYYRVICITFNSENNVTSYISIKKRFEILSKQTSLKSHFLLTLWYMLTLRLQLKVSYFQNVLFYVIKSPKKQTNLFPKLLP